MVLLSTKYKSKRFGELSENDVMLHANALVARISIITGWVIPDDEFYLNTLISEFVKFLTEKYHDLNPDEIAYAFRTYGTTVKDWGKSMNLSLIDEPIRKYLSVRACLSEMEERKAPVNDKPLLIEPIFDENELLSSVKFIYQKTKKVGLLSAQAYDILAARKVIDLSIEQKKTIRQTVISRLKAEALEEGEKAVAALKKLSERDYEVKVRNECKKQAVANHFDNEK